MKATFNLDGREQAKLAKYEQTNRYSITFLISSCKYSGVTHFNHITSNLSAICRYIKMCAWQIWTKKITTQCPATCHQFCVFGKKNISKRKYPWKKCSNQLDLPHKQTGYFEIGSNWLIKISYRKVRLGAKKARNCIKC